MFLRHVLGVWRHPGGVVPEVPQDGRTSRGGTTAGAYGTELLRNGQTTLNEALRRCP